MSYRNLFVSKEDQIAQTPKEIISFIQNKFNNGKRLFDPCPADWNINKHGNGLKIAWKKKNYVNPPFAQTELWFEKAIQESKNGNTSIFLLPCRFHTFYFQKIMKYITCIYLITKPIVFVGYTRPIPIGMCLIVFGPYKHNLKKSILIAHNPAPHTQATAIRKIATYSKNYSVINNSVSVPLEKAIDRGSEIIMCPSRLNNKSIQNNALEKAKHLIFLHPTFRKNKKRFVDGTVIFVMGDNPIVNDEWIRSKIKYGLISSWFKST
jgi:hypothetical protein